jgi:chromosome segregation protein
VTRLGEVLESDGTIKAGPLTAAMGLLSRRSELEALGQQIAEVDERIARLGRQLSDDHSAARSLEDEIGILRNALYASSTVKVQTSGTLAQNADAIGALQREQPVLAAELASLEQSIGQLAREQAELTGQRNGLEQEQSAAHKQVEELTAEQRTASDELRQLGEDLTAARVQLGQAQEKQLASRQAVQRQTAAQGELGQQIERVAQSAAALHSRQEAVERELSAAAAEESTVGGAETAVQSRLAELTAELTERTRAAETLALRVEELRSRRQDVEQDLHKLDLAVGEETVRLQSLVQRAQEEMQLDLPAKYAERPYEEQEADYAVVADEIRELRDKISRLGNVNRGGDHGTGGA